MLIWGGPLDTFTVAAVRAHPVLGPFLAICCCMFLKKCEIWLSSPKMRVRDERSNEDIDCKPKRNQACLVSDEHQ